MKNFLSKRLNMNGNHQTGAASYTGHTLIKMLDILYFTIDYYLYKVSQAQSNDFH